MAALVALMPTSRRLQQALPEVEVVHILLQTLPFNVTGAIRRRKIFTYKKA
jgi:hypothetical protein